ncbi:nuclear transcription factor Y subunit A-7 [Dendrobium catenatum]|uniref:Nuclear transcription factor Y subunit n=1 Tax=Dendrobium catenatum TaxID=906689 RepID=A0A2I0X1S2_9ASPA|nr:nuclear transcription factor Y subunit A-7 [Dendrobium catenatum]XP_020689951.1 nuclear transcription factor Y subunit A-7 [Dendrobium catenatum]XP_020689952.1 nuclear transcription factor Y subunit A-7 [Dendrobium catenatum]XP_020689953.1 nuclear transcription factor Y subunit A-7 [Dendrobium catenatum]XP_020689954.1 nuclear transcription factor Y subunit A-7 [Dendrobium catenatum]PKU81851.1 Nuclear transcription factor Y subunit A-7 [Dendrobium catenatum]
MMTSAAVDFSGSESSGEDEPQKQSLSETENQASTNGSFQPGIAMPSTVHFVPHSQLAAGHIMAPVAYPYVDPYYGGIIAAYSGQHLMHPTMTGIMQPGVPLPTDTVEEPVYVNAKQYHGILRRRQSRAKAESENKLIKSRKPYIHESRHLHAMRRARGNGGRFLNSKGKDDQDLEASSHDNSQLCNAPASQNPASS